MPVTLTIALALATLIALWLWRTHLSPQAKLRRAQAAEATAALREAVLARNFLQEAAPDPTEIRTIAMDWSVGGGQLATVVSHSDGTVSLYLSSGAGFIGAGTFSAVQVAAKAWWGVAEPLRQHFRPVDSWPPPAAGKCIFYMITREQTLASDVFSASELKRQEHPFHSLGAHAQRLITAIRTSRQASGKVVQGGAA